MKKYLTNLGLILLAIATMTIAPCNLASAQTLEERLRKQAEEIKKLKEPTAEEKKSALETEACIREYARVFSLNRPKSAKIEVLKSEYQGVYKIISTIGRMGEEGYLKVESSPLNWIIEKQNMPIGATLSYRPDKDDSLLFNIAKFNSKELGYEMITVVLAKYGKEKIEQIMYSTGKDDAFKTIIIKNGGTKRTEEIVDKKEIKLYLEILDSILVNYGVEKN